MEKKNIKKYGQKKEKYLFASVSLILLILIKNIVGANN